MEESISNGWSYNSGTRKITWNIGTLASGGAETVTFKAKVANTVSTGAKIITTSNIWCKEETVATSAQAITTVGAPVITSITPDKGGNAGTVTVTIKGQNLDPNAVVKLVKAGEQDVVANYVAGLNSGTGITATFNFIFIGKTPGYMIWW
ncbi:IPT/TIG domain-containing protein [Candidatus Desantisbacteria bacterium]|nr:IPT/TIG domain-containing protein [Candidatus Desantisbacteria bacterium]